MAAAMDRTPEQWTYDVFLSFRGADVRASFLSHLYASLKRNSILTFFDDVELERGEYISQKLLEAIETSKILIVVLSQDYASSTWCLDELVHIVKCRRSNHQQLVFPIFFYADPSDVRWQKGSYAKSFSKHKCRYPLNKVKDWRQALTEVANLSGWDMRYWNEAKFIEDISREILKRLSCRHLYVPSYAVGMESRLQHISTLLSIGLDDVRVVGIYGMGGIGKTTLAKVAFNEFSHLFEGSSFLENFSEFSKKPGGRTHLQQQLLSDILKRNDIELNGLDHAVKERFRSKKVLIVIDNVDDIHQLNSAAMDPKWLGSGSRIIITTRNMHLLKQLRVEGSCSPNELSGDESLELLSWHAFRASKPPKEFLHLSEEVVAYCAGLPLAVEVLGAFLIERSISEWESMLKLLKQIPCDNIQEKLRMSFDALSSVQKDVFLDIACFFIGMDRDYVACILEGCDFYPDIVLSVLMERCLITICDNRILMHDLLRDMGRQIVRDISPKNSGDRSRLWAPDDVVSVLTKKSGTNAIEGISLKAEVKDVQHLEVEAFTKMQELRLLQLSNVNLTGSYEHFPKDLRWLRWHGFSSESFPTNFNLRSLVVMEMQYSNIKRFREAQAHPQVANKLKYLDLSCSIYLKETPDFSYFPNLEKLLLLNCKSLVTVHKSIGILHKKLLLINLAGCTELYALPEELYKLKSLETLILSGCLKFEKLDDALGELESLKKLAADFTALSEIPSSISRLKKLEKLSLKGCKGSLSDSNDKIHYGEPRKQFKLLLPKSLNSLSCLGTLCLGYCNLSDEMIPKDLGSMSCLKDLDLRGNSFRNPQTDFASLPNLHVLRMSDCSELQSMLSLPQSLLFFYAEKCISLERTPDFSECSSLNRLYLSGCVNLVETPGICNHKRLSLIDMERCKLAPNTTSKMILEDWIESNRGCIFLPESTLPNWINFKEKMRSFSFTIPETQNFDPVVGFTLWTRYEELVEGKHLNQILRAIMVKNQTRGGAWIHRISRSNPLESNILTEDFRIETGDQVEVSVDCDDSMTIMETGFAFAYKARDISFDDIQFTSKIDIRRYYGDDVNFLSLGVKSENSLVHKMTYAPVGDKRRETFYACSVFLETPRQEMTQPVVKESLKTLSQELTQPVVEESLETLSQEMTQPVMEESHHRYYRKIRAGLRTLVGTISILALFMLMENWLSAPSKFRCYMKLKQK